MGGLEGFSSCRLLSAEESDWLEPPGRTAAGYVSVVGPAEGGPVFVFISLLLFSFVVAWWYSEIAPFTF